MRLRRDEAMAKARAIDARLCAEDPDRPVLIGQAPGRDTEGWPPFFGGATGKRLAELAGLSWLGLVQRCERRNLIERYPGARRGGDDFPMAEAREAAARMIPALSGRRVVLVGRLVALAFGFPLEMAPPFALYTARPWTTSLGTVRLQLSSAGGRRQRGEFEVAWIPHPSGRNRLYNDHGRRAEARAFLRDLLELDNERGRA